MDLTQSKLSKQEWQTTEIPVSEQEASILQLIMQGYENPDIRMNLNLSLAGFMKIPEDQRSALEPHLFQTFFAPLSSSHPVPNSLQKDVIKGGKKGGKSVVKKADAIRIENMTANIEKNRGLIFEFVLLSLVAQMDDSLRAGSPVYASCLYSLVQLRKSSVAHVNQPLLSYVDAWVHYAAKKLPLMEIVAHAEEYIEKNRLLGKYADLTLFTHQRDLFRLFNGSCGSIATGAKADGNGSCGTKADGNGSAADGNGSIGPTLVLYIAPTGTGKTLSPLGLASGGRAVLFVCSARHVGLSLARAAVSVQKRVAFAYGCASAEDIRLHNFAAVDYMVNKRSGAIAKVDNTNGSRVEIMICDVRSYLIAMRYMLEFHPEDQLLLYWDEPTITMDYDDHPLHDTIHRVWAENQVSRIVLSCATLPKEEEIQTSLDDYRLRFSSPDQGAQIKSIVSYDFKKSISLLQSDGKCCLPHLLFPAFRDLLESVEHIKSNKTLLRYMDLGEISRFLRGTTTPQEVAAHFENQLGNITLSSVKLYYLKRLEEMDEESWPRFHTFFVESLQGKFSSGAAGGAANKKNSASPDFHKSRSLDAIPQPPGFTSPPVGHSLTQGETGLAGSSLCRIQSVSYNLEKPKEKDPLAGVKLSTEDAWTLTDGPTIYIAENVENMALFFLKQTALPAYETDEIMRRIQQNTLVQRRVEALEREIEDKKGKDGLKEKKIERDQFSREVKGLEGELARFQAQIETVRLRLDYLPNSAEHQQRFGRSQANAFVPRISEEDVVRIMQLDVDMNKKVLLLIGIGVFQLGLPTPYLELMKELAAEQKLFLILASSDYIYGTNYAFCHGFVSKDLTNMTQQKTIQAMGRIGRNLVQQDYTVRFRNDALIRSLFLPVQGVNKEAETMCRLFS
jgi:hypothetical protein